MLDEFLSRLTFGPKRALCVAVSGGGDSMALLVATHAWCGVRGDVKLTALTVDHGLRAEAADEAAAVGAFCAARGIAPRTLAWNGAKPKAGVSAAARSARHALLAQGARDAGATIVLAGHTFDDQAETVVMRAARGSGRGEAGIAPATLFEGCVWFVRPMLGLRREALRIFLRDRGVGWADDPSNRDPAYERARIRERLTESERQAAAARAAEQGLLREELGERAAAVTSAHAGRVARGLLRLDMASMEQDPEAWCYALRILLSTVGGRGQLVDDARVRELTLRSLAAATFRISLSGCVVEWSRHGFFLHREARDLPVGVLTAAGCDWDGRFRVSPPPGERGGLLAGPTGDHAAIGADAGAASRRLLRGAAGAEPSVRRLAEGEDKLDTFAGAHEVAGASFTPLIAPWRHHLPSFDLAPARAVARLIGAPEIPPVPFARHIHVT